MHNHCDHFRRTVGRVRSCITYICVEIAVFRDRNQYINGVLCPPRLKMDAHMLIDTLLYGLYSLILVLVARRELWV